MIPPDPPPGRRLLREALALLACGVLIVLAIARLDPGLAAATLPREGLLGLVLLNALPALCLYALLVGLLRRALLPAWLVLLVLGGLFAANARKLAMLETPVLPADFRLFAEPGPAVALLAQYIHMDLLHWLALIGAAAFTVLLFLERRLALLARWRAPIVAVLAAGLLATLVAGSWPWNRLYNAHALGFQPWTLSQSSLRTGLVNSLLLYNWQVGTGDVPSGDRAAALAFLHRHGADLRAALDAGADAATLPDIVVVQSESLFDPARVNGVPEGRFLRQLDRLRKIATSGDMQVPTFVGGTIRTEFEVLTGAPLASLGGLQYPWLELARSDYPNLARLLGERGYTRTAIHPNAAAFWNRARTYPALGFEHFIDSSEFDQNRIVGLFLSDEAMTDRILEELVDEGPPQFLFAISMENHGPFDWRPNLDPERLAALPMPEKLDAGGRLWFGNYLYLLHDADHELGRLAGALRQRKRRSLLLFYGDHLPGLAPVYFQLGFKDGRDAREQPVPWLLLDTANPHPARLDTTSWLLPGLLLQAAGVHDDAWFSLLATLARDPEFDPDDADARSGIEALARLQLHGELAPVLEEAMASGRQDNGAGS
ncbi:MAG: LTA synthase family protein [Xanthomonadales bacterium]|nr:LTA synthase family protein [Xanthomonadales bacterium]